MLNILLRNVLLNADYMINLDREQTALLTIKRRIIGIRFRKKMKKKNACSFIS